MTAASYAMDLRRPFGDAASRYTARLPETVSVIACEPEYAVSAFAAAADLKRRGIMFYAAPLLEDSRALLAQTVSGELLTEFTGVDERRTVFDSLANEQLAISVVLQTVIRPVGDPYVRVLRDLIIMSDAVIARSSVEAAMIARVCGYRRRFNVIAPGTDVDIPAVSPQSRHSIVVWAPRLPAARLGVIAMALDSFKCDLIFVCASGQLPDVHGSFVEPECGAASLASAACIIDASIADPAAAIALAQFGVPLIAASTSGAAEFVGGIFEYDPWNFRSIHAAVSRARGAPAPILRRPALPFEDLRDTLLQVAPPVSLAGPLVSIILPTFNRPCSLAKSLDSIGAQTYQNLDVIVMNDGGTDITEVCAKYAFVRLVNLEKNTGYSRASRAGMNFIRGKYFCFWADDDVYFPDHFARIVDALETSDERVAHTNTLTRYYVDRPDGGEQTRAYKIIHERPNDPVEMMTGPTMTFGLMLFRRDVIEEIGYVDPLCGLLDVEYQLRASQRYDFIAVDNVTGQWNYNIEQKTYTSQIGVSRFVTEENAIYAKYPSELACVNDRRAKWLKKLVERFHTVIWPPDLYLPDDFSD